MIDFKKKKIDDEDHINILMLTRGRPDKAVRAIKSLDNLAKVKNKA